MKNNESRYKRIAIKIGSNVISRSDGSLNARGFVDLIIPRGSRNLIDFVRENATIPVIETGAGIC